MATLAKITQPTTTKQNIIDQSRAGEKKKKNAKNKATYLGYICQGSRLQPVLINTVYCTFVSSPASVQLTTKKRQQKIEQKQ